MPGSREHEGARGSLPGLGSGFDAGPPATRLLLWVGLLALSLALGCGHDSAPRNVLLISLDTLRADHLGLYGHVRATSPRLDGFAGTAIVFDRAVAPAANTPPSQASMMTSVDPGRHGFTGNDDRLPDRFPTLAERLQQGGWKTGGFVDGGYLSASFGFDRGFEVYDDRAGGFAAILPKARRWLEGVGDAPFFLFLHTYDIHAPYAPPLPYRDMFHEVPFRGSFEPTAHNMHRAFERDLTLTEAERRHAVLRYDEGIRYVDDLLGDFLDELERRGVLDQTLVIVTSDHGEEFGEHGSYLHWQLFYEPILRVPLILRPPGGVSGGRRVGDLAELLDVAPTILDAVGESIPEAMQGRSLLGEKSGADGLPVALAWPPNPATMSIRSLIHGRYQLRFHAKGSPRLELYDLEAEAASRTDVAALRPRVAEAYHERARELLGRTATHEPAAQPIAEELRSQLEALGYIQDD